MSRHHLLVFSIQLIVLIPLSASAWDHEARGQLLSYGQRVSCQVTNSTGSLMTIERITFNASCVDEGNNYSHIEAAQNIGYVLPSYQSTAEISGPTCLAGRPYAGACFYFYSLSQ